MHNYFEIVVNTKHINLEQHKKHYMESDKRAYMNLYIAYMNLNQHEKQ
jgi:hypothetical protein